MDPPILVRVKQEPCCEDVDEIGTEQLEAITVAINVKLEFEEELSCDGAAGVDEVVGDDRDVEKGKRENKENDREVGVKLEVPEKIEREEEEEFGDGEIEESATNIGDNEIRPKKKRDRKYECDTCGKMFQYPSALKTHETIHTGNKPFECGECGKKFIQKSVFTIHRRIHTGQTPFQC